MIQLQKRQMLAASSPLLVRCHKNRRSSTCTTNLPERSSWNCLVKLIKAVRYINRKVSGEMG